ncbi:DNA-binding transcriptional regulator, AcrR family [Arachidicoccus rhizosphaerae]|jgi:AcrR family transcriptional regulator|uniref:DNA-binding transcriptional regulator, AcrR family n=1 Tax=Arachidicoccus rhizosphaerae TaxID=551991 RepID=A0A1H3X942_9BACT|nr:TetR/AcrR family transcriptional regulator [Arachidicoccus rhizosphaerae]SDZ95935.1 DNA-binding transcriptional regulator, AcrR family [Arachidicoccus rhizosphaerae]
MGISERKARQKENVRSQILEMAWQIVKDEGWQALSIRKIADGIEYSVPVIYDHFANKEAILFELSLHGFDLLQQELDKNMNIEPAEARLRAHVESYWHFAFRNKEYYQLMYGLGMPCCGAGKMNAQVNIFRDRILEDIEKVMQQRGSDMSQLCFKSYALWSIIHGLISIMQMRVSDIDNTLNKQVLTDSVEAFINNL